MAQELSDALTPGRRAALVLSILKGEISEADAALRNGLDPATIEDWKRRFLRGAELALDEPRTEQTTRLARLPGGWRSRVAMVAVALIWLVLRIAFWNGYYTEDAPGYVTDAIWTSRGYFQVREYVNGMNVGTYLPVALPLMVLGKSEIALAVWPLFSSLLGVVSMGAVTWILFGSRYGLLAALLYATYPGDVFFSTVVMPDSIQSGWLTLALLLIVLAYTGPAGQRRWRLVAGGVAIGVCHLIRAGDAMLLPVGVGAAAIFSTVVKRDAPAAIIRDGLTFAAGWAAVNAIEGLFYFAAAGDFLLRFHVINRHYGTFNSIQQWGLNHDPLTIPFSLFAPLSWWWFGGWWQLNQDQAYHGLLFCAALLSLSAGLAALVLLRQRVAAHTLAGFLVALIWFVWPLLYHQFGSQSLSHFVPIHRLSRHLVVYAPGAIFATVSGGFLIGQAMTASWLRGPRTLLIVAAAPCLLLLHLSVNWQGEQIAYRAYQNIKGTYARIRERLPAGVQTIVGDPGDLCFFDFWLNPPGAEKVKMMAFANYRSCEQLQSGVVLTRANPGWDGGAIAIQETVSRLPCLMQPPAGWRLLYSGYPEKIYEIAEGP
jgi:hypothetical protein